MSRFGQQFLSEVAVRGYVTAFVDLLGLSNRLLGLDALCRPENHANAKQIVGRSLAPVRFLRKSFEEFYRSFESAHSEALEANVQQLPEPLHQLWKELHTHESVIHWYSDCVSISVPINSESNVTTMRGICSMFNALSVVYLQMLASHQPMRGGVEIGFGAEITDGEVIGSCLAKAYRIEQRANTPRICIGAEVLRLIEHETERRQSEPTDAICGYLARLSKSCLMVDSDEAVCINPLNPRFLKSLHREPRAKILYESFGFILAELRRATVAGDASLITKYEWLRDVFSHADLESCIRANSKDHSGWDQLE